MAVTPNPNIIYREEKGPLGNEAYNLTPQEVDGNFKKLEEETTALDTRVETLENAPATVVDEFSTLTGDTWDLATDSSKKDIALTAGRTLTIQNYPESFVGMLHVTENNSFTLLANGEDITSKIRTTGETMLGVVKTRLGLRYYPDGGVSGGGGGANDGDGSAETDAYLAFMIEDNFTQAQKDAILALASWKKGNNSAANAALTLHDGSVDYFLFGSQTNAARTGRGFKGAINLVYNGVPTLTPKGLKGNGTNFSADTTIKPSTRDHLNVSYSMYITEAQTTGVGYQFGAGRSVGEYAYTYASVRNTAAYTGISGAPGNGEKSVASGGQVGFWQIQRLAGILKVYKNGVEIPGPDNADIANEVSDLNLYLFALRLATDINSYSDVTLGYFEVGQPMTDAQALEHYNKVHAVQVAFGRV